MNHIEQMGLNAALQHHMQSHIDAGATIHPGQCGQTVIQYPDYYLVGGGLVWARNPGKWSPRLIFDDQPTRDGLGNGEIAVCLKSKSQMVWFGGQWHEI